MQAMKQGNYKWIMVYQDHLTKFCVLRPLTSKRAAEVAYQLLDIFLLLGAPEILQVTTDRSLLLVLLPNLNCFGLIS